MNEAITHLVFVYGSLKAGYALHGLLSHQTFEGTTQTTSDFRLYDLGRYPGLKRASVNGSSIRGEVYRIDDECLRRLDDEEGVDDGLYTRERIQLQAPFQFQAVWTYIYAGCVDNCPDCGSEWPRLPTDG